MSFRNRLALFLMASLVCVQIAMAAFAYVYLREQVISQGRRDLGLAMQAFTRQLDFLARRASDGVEVLALDYALRSAIARSDHETELSVLRNHGDRIGAGRMILVRLDGSIAADTARPVGAATAFPLPGLIRGAATRDRGTALMMSAGRLYWIVAVPVRAPIPIAFIAAFIPVDGTLLEHMRGISSSPHAILLATQKLGGRWTVVARSRGDLARELPPISIASPRVGIVGRDEAEYLAIAAPLKTAKGSDPVVAVIDYPLHEAFRAFRGLIVPMLALLAMGLVVAALGATLIVRRMVRPLGVLVQASERIAAGDYSKPPAVLQQDEFGHLARAISDMAGAIGEREAALNAARETAELSREHAVRANEAKSQFLANMSHELRTPLNAIVGFGEMLSQEVLGPIGVRRYVEYARDIQSSGEKLRSLFERMLDVAEAGSRNLAIARDPVLVSDVLTAATELHRSFARSAQVDLVLVPTQSAVCISGDARRLRHAFAEVIHNAIKFTPSGGVVTVSSRIEAGSVTICVADTGIGIDPEQLTRILEPFQRLKSAVDGQHQGAGLGLARAKAIVERHGGSISVASTVGTGTSVAMCLPTSAVAMHDAA